MNPSKNRNRSARPGIPDQQEDDECKESVGYRYDKPKNRNQEKVSSRVENQTSLSDAVQKSLDHTLRAYFIHTMEKIECLSGQLLRTECVIAKMHLDIVERITKLCERSIVQYQSLTEHIDNRMMSGEKLKVGYTDNNTNGSDENSDDFDCFNIAQTSDLIQKSQELRKSDLKQHSINNLERKNLDLETASDCEEKIRNLNQELLCTKLELEECLKRLQHIKEIEEKQRLKQTASEKIQITNNQKMEEICDEMKLKIPRPPQPPCQCECTKKQYNQKDGYDSETAQSSLKRPREKRPTRKISKTVMNQPQDYPSPAVDRKKQTKP